VQLTVQNLACRRSGRLIVSGLSFTLTAGEALVVTGHNGAGKSTLLALVAGRLRPEDGAVAAAGIGEASLPERLHWIGHRDALKSALTAEENLAFARDLLGGPALAPRDALEAVGLAHAAPLPVAYLSAGQRRRVGARPPPRGAPPPMAPRRADRGPRRGRAGDAGAADARPPRRRRPRRGGDPPGPRDRGGEDDPDRAGSRPLSPRAGRGLG
jgi:hypothetical protein